MVSILPGGPIIVALFQITLKLVIDNKGVMVLDYLEEQIHFLIQNLS